MEAMNKSTCQETVKRIEEKLYQHEKELSGLKQVYKSIQDLAISINNLTSETKYIRQDLGDLKEDTKSINRRIDVIELKPAEKWDKVIWIIIASIITLLVGVIFAKLK